MVRKAQKSGVVVSDEDSINALKILARLHRQNIEAMGGRPKNWAVFEAIRETFVYDKDYKIYLAYKDGAVIAALLVLFFNRTAEYFVPVTHRDFRTFQPMSLLVFEVMRETVGRGILYWNWGGTWLSQSGVYRFKSRWGTHDAPYYYYVKVYDDKVLNYSKGTLLEQFPYYYVVPFFELNEEKKRANN
jgi:lipid II:glycine glycyltransferase (peptidoglycan interpeptide bridge formation enzyme)